MSILSQVTVLVAVFNKKEIVRDCIESLLKLDPAPIRILFVDGGSTDGTFQILQEEYKNKIDLYQLPVGHSNRMNWALDNINTKYTALTDADCVVKPNWLAELLKGFSEEKNVIATAGYCGTPKNIAFLQKLIGLEMDNRFDNFPRYLYRAPTMNLCFKTDIARKIRFDEKQKVAIETDFGYRLTKLGKMVYMPKAKVLHYHRSTLKDYFKQQKNQAEWGPRLILKHGKKSLTDQITTLKMTLQIPLFFLSLVFLLFSFINQIFLFPLILMIVSLLIIYLKIIREISPPGKLYLPFLGLFFFIYLAWLV